MWLVKGAVRNTNVHVPLIVLITMLMGLSMPPAQAKSKSSSLNIIPVITNIIFIKGQIVASGTASAVVKGKAVNAAFSGVPIDMALAPDQSGTGSCVSLQVRLSPITVTLGGLTVETGPIGLTATTFYPQHSLLGELLCSMGNLLKGGLSLRQIMQGESVLDPVTRAVIIPGINGTQYNLLLADLTVIYNASLAQFPGADLAGISVLPPILINLTDLESPVLLDFECAPETLSAFGVEMFLDDCSGGPVSLAITAIPETGLLGSQLASLVTSGKLRDGTLTDVLDQLLARPAF
jgi:hypothetical protein